jgi:hypothetical protein
MDSDSSTESSDELSLPPELLERERQLMERNQQLEARLKDLLRSTSLESEDLFPSMEEQPVKQKPKSKPKPKPKPKPEPKPDLPPARVSASKPGIIEVEVPTHVEPVREVRVDPVPELRAAYHKITQEIRSLREQIVFVETNHSKCDSTIAKLQFELKKIQTENDRSQHFTVEMTKQIEASQETILKLKSEISAARLSRIERVQKENEAKQKRTQIEQKIRRQQLNIERLQSELNSAQNVEFKLAKMNADKTKWQQDIDEGKKAVRQLRMALSEVQRMNTHEEKIFHHIQGGKEVALSCDALEKAIGELLN